VSEKIYARRIAQSNSGAGGRNARMGAQVSHLQEHGQVSE